MHMKIHEEPTANPEPKRIVTVRVPVPIYRMLKDITGDTDQSNAEVVSAAIKLYAQTLAASEGRQS